MGILSRGKDVAEAGAHAYGKAWAKVSPSRYRSAHEAYMAIAGGGKNNVYQHIKGLRSGPANAAPVALRAVERSQQTDAPPEVPPAPQPDKGGALAAIAKGIQTAIGWEQQLTKVFGKIPFPKMSALTVGDWSIGLPHAHNHPPNLVPPSTVPIPMPSAGPVLKIPILSGADHTKHGGKPAAMCGDMGLAMAPWCGGYVPMFEVYLGSAHVWIEGNRAARVLCDVVKHCTFTTPKPSDPPLGPMVGVSTGGVSHVGIGGVPLPSFFSIAVGKAFQGLAWAGGKVFRKLTAKSFVDDLTRIRKVNGVEVPPPIQYNHAMSDVDKLAVERDLIELAKTRTGRANLKRVAKAYKKKGYTMTMSNHPTPGEAFGWTAGGWNPAGYRGANGKPGPGFHSEVAYNPKDWPNPQNPGTTSASVLNHEVNHAANAMEGKLVNDKWTPDGGFGKQLDANGNVVTPGRWYDYEEFQTTHVDNAFRRETGLKQRKNYCSPIP